jgi:hypothetical protein
VRALLRAAIKHADYKKAIKASEAELGQTIVKRFEGVKKRPGR